MLNDIKTLSGILSLAFCLFLQACSSSDLQLQSLSQDIYSRQKWQEPLPPREFVSDGCSLWPDNEWVECCVVHDAVYWRGGTRAQRKQADSELRQCVSTSGHPIMAWIMYYGVRSGGVYWLPTSFRWGFGWEYPQSGPPGISY